MDVLGVSPGALRKPARQFDEMEFAGVLELEIVEARGLLAMDTNILGMKTSSDPYCVASVETERWTSKTRVIATSLNPKWDERFELSLRYPDPVVKFDLYDKDLASKDDYLGCVDVDLSLCESGRRYEGWLPLSHPEYTVTGMLRIGVKIHSTPISEILGYMRKNMKGKSPDPPPIPRFNINHLYGPWMLTIDIVLTRTILPIVYHVMDAIYWTTPKWSAGILFLWFPLCYYMQYWPSLFFFALALAMLRNRRRGYSTLQDAELLTGEPASPSSPVKAVKAKTDEKGTAAGGAGEDGGPNDKLTLGGFVSQATALMPGWLKTYLASLQLPSKSTADTFLYLYDIFHWRNAQSDTVFKIFLALGTLLVFLPFWIFSYVVGLVLMLLSSPALALVFGVVSHFTHPPRLGVAKFTASYDEELASHDSRRLSQPPKGAINKLLRKLS